MGYLDCLTIGVHATFRGRVIAFDILGNKDLIIEFAQKGNCPCGLAELRLAVTVAVMFVGRNACQKGADNGTRKTEKVCPHPVPMPGFAW